MNILFFTYDFPFPTNSGGKARAFNLLKFSRGKHSISLFSFIRSDFKEEYKKELEKIGIKDIKLFKRKSVKNIDNAKNAFGIGGSVFHALYFDKKILQEIIDYIKENKIDLVHFESFYTGYYISEKLKELGVKQIFGSENIEYKLYEDYSQKVPKAVRFPLSLQVRKIKKEEMEMAKEADATFAVTGFEEEYFKEAGSKKTFVIPNGVDIEEFKYKPSHRHNGHKILFVGNFSYFPNRDAIEFFYQHAFKRLEGKYHLTIIGKGTDKLGIKDDRVTLTEFISDIKDAYYDADVMVSPIRIGGGTNFKLIEAAACGVPIIAHPARVEGLGFTPGEDILTAATGPEFISALQSLLENDGLQGKLSKNARTLIEKNYSWQKIGAKLDKIWSSL